MNKLELEHVIEKHRKWLYSEDGGVRADLRSANLRYANLRYANLSYANLSSADLRYANLSSANLRDANLRYADLSSANLRYANLSYANLSSADLSSADLSYANLRYADLRDANLSSATGELKYLKSIFIDKYPITYTSDVLQIGCERHNIAEWWEFDDDRIIKMDAGALKLWKKWGTMIKNIIEMSPAEPTKTGENNV